MLTFPMLPNRMIYLSHFLLNTWALICLFTSSWKFSPVPYSFKMRLAFAAVLFSLSHMRLLQKAPRLADALRPVPDAREQM